MSEIGHNSAVNEGHLKAFIERIESLNSEIKDRNDDKSALFAEVKSAGYDPKVVKEVVKIRSQDRDKRIEFESVLDVYLAAVGLG